MIILGVDPGTTTGFSFLHFDEESKTSSWITLGEWRKDACFRGMRDNFGKFTPDVVVIEDFELRPTNVKNNIRHTKGFVALPVPKLIGAFEYWAYLNGKRYEEQNPSEKPMGYKLCGLPYKAGIPGTHIFDSQAHVAVFVNRHLGGFKYAERAFK